MTWSALALKQLFSLSCQSLLPEVLKIVALASAGVCVLRNTFLTSYLKLTAFAGGGGGGAPVMGGAAAGGGAAPAGDAAAEEKKEEKKEEEEESEDEVGFISLSPSHCFGSGYLQSATLARMPCNNNH